MKVDFGAIKFRVRAIKSLFIAIRCRIIGKSLFLTAEKWVNICSVSDVFRA